VAKPVGVPGAHTPTQMHPQYSPAPSPLISQKKVDKSKMVGTGKDLEGFGIQDMDVSQDDLLALVEELGLGGDDASDFVRGLGSDSKAKSTPPLAKADASDEEKPAKEEKPADKEKPEDTPPATEKAESPETETPKKEESVAEKVDTENAKV